MLVTALIGFALGWVGSIPVAGPISALVLTRGLEGRFRAGVFIAIGGALAEAAYAFLAFYGFSTLLTDYPIIKPLSNAAGAVVLAALGVSFVRKQGDAPESKAPPRDTDLGSFFLGASICAMNPALIATWTAATTALYASDAVQVTGAHATPFAAGCALGISGWFITLLALVRRYRGRFTPATLAKVVRVIGAALLALALWFAYRFVMYFVSG
jgi:threonine/homoserine/homoserine lactone efflux protein